MHFLKKIFLSLPIIFVCNSVIAQILISDIPYIDHGHERHVLDIYTPENSGSEKLPVLFWIHGGGWQKGDKSDVGLKPAVLTERGYVFVSTNYRLLPEVEIDELIHDVAKSLGWVHKHISTYGGDPNRILVGGHSAGAQLAALICIDDRYLSEERVPFEVLKGCIPVDGGAYDISKNIMATEFQQALYGTRIPKSGIRNAFGNDPEKHFELSAVTHIKENKNIPPFLILYFSGNLKTRSQSRLLESELIHAGIKAKAYGKRDSNHLRLNNDLGKPDDPATQELLQFIDIHAK